MVKIMKLEVLPHAHLRLTFDDGAVRVVDMNPSIRDSPLTRPLADAAYFAQVAVYPNGRGLFWPNDYDMCPDWLRYHAPGVEEAGSTAPSLAASPPGAPPAADTVR